MDIPDYSQLLGQFSSLGIALGIGLLVGSERGWHHRGHSEGGRVAGIRTFTLLALLGAVVAGCEYHHGRCGNGDLLAGSHAGV